MILIPKRRYLKMKRLSFLVVFYCIIHGASGDFSARYEGMDQQTVAKMIQATYGAPFDFVNEAAFNTFTAAHQPKFHMQASTSSPTSSSM